MLVMSQDLLQGLALGILIGLALGLFIAYWLVPHTVDLLVGVVRHDE